MNHYILFYKTVKDFIEKRAPFREAHLNKINKAHEDGILIMAGALDDPTDEAMLVFKCDNEAIVIDFAKNDPYVKNGVILDWQISQWNVVVGNTK